MRCGRRGVRGVADRFGWVGAAGKEAERLRLGAGAGLALTGAAAALGAAALAGLPPEMGVQVPAIVGPLGAAGAVVAGGWSARRLWGEVGASLTWRMPRRRPPHAGALPLWLGFCAETGRVEAVSMEALPHLLVGGQTRGGKSSFLRQALVGLIEWTQPEAVRLVIVDYSAPPHPSGVLVWRLPAPLNLASTASSQGMPATPPGSV